MDIQLLPDIIDRKLNGTGNWRNFAIPITYIRNAAESWKAHLRGISKPWLCWNVNQEWCLLQQRIVLEMGWTPVVGWDPLHQSRPKRVLEGTIVIDFNSHFGFETLWPHFPLEFAFLWTDRLAFWHADLLVKLPLLNKIVSIFDSLQNGEMAAVRSIGGLRNIFYYRTHRYWELIGCTTSRASFDQFEKGCGCWRNFKLHPNCPDKTERERRNKYYYDSGVSIMYWKRRYGGIVRNISQNNLIEGHFSETSGVSKKYKKYALKGQELEQNFYLSEEVKRLGLAHLYNEIVPYLESNES